MDLLPQGAWFGLTRKRLYLMLLCLGFAVALLLVAYLGARTFLYFKARQAADLLERVYAVRIGDPESSLTTLFNRYEDRERESLLKLKPGTVVAVDPWHFYRSFSKHDWIDSSLRDFLFEFVPNTRRRLGLRAWIVGAGFDFKDGKVSAISVDLIVEGENEWLDGSSYLVRKLSEEALERRGIDIASHPDIAHYYAHWSHLHMGGETGEVLVNNLDEDANWEQLQAGREFNLRCLTSFRGCHSLCDLMPKATTYRHAHHYPGLGWNSGSWGPQDQSCE